jgi:hypothetical protein
MLKQLRDPACGLLAAPGPAADGKESKEGKEATLADMERLFYEGRGGPRSPGYLQALEKQRASGQPPGKSLPSALDLIEPLRAAHAAAVAKRERERAQLLKALGDAGLGLLPKGTPLSDADLEKLLAAGVPSSLPCVFVTSSLWPAVVLCCS